MEVTADTPPALSSPPTLEDQGEIMEVEKIGQAVESLCLKDVPAKGIPTPGVSSELETMMGSLIRQVGNMMSARFAAIEDRLLPEKILRPPLQADKGKRHNGVGQEVKDVERDRSLVTQGKEKGKEKGKVKKEGKERGKKAEKASILLPAKENDTVPSPAPPTSLVSYADVAEKGKKGKREVATVKVINLPKKDGSSATTRASSTHNKVDGLSPGGKGPPKKGKRDRKTAAVVITVLPQPRAEEGQLPEPSTEKGQLPELGLLWPRSYRRLPVR